MNFMKLNTIINRYLFREMMPPFAITLLFFTLMFLMARAFTVSKLIVLYRIGLADVLLILFYSVPYLLSYILPISTMLAILLMFIRLSSDNEITALKTGGMSVYRMLPPVLLLCVFAAAVTLVMTLYGTQWAKRTIRDTTLKIASTNLNIGLKERTFNDKFKGVMLYVNEIDYQTKALIDVFVEDQRRKDVVSIVVAPKGMLYGEPEKQRFHLKLFSGTINQVNLDDRSINSVNFESYDLILDFNKIGTDAKKKKRKDIAEMSLNEIYQYIDNKIRKKDFDDNFYRAKMNLYMRFSVPFACIALGILAVPLGISIKTSKRTYGLGIGLVMFLVYYILLSIGLTFGEYGQYPPIIGMWLPSVGMTGLRLYLLSRTANERPIEIGLFLRRLGERFRLKKEDASPGTENRAAHQTHAANDWKNGGKDRLMEDERLYLRSKNSDVFHRSNCKWLKRINPESMVRFRTREEAVEEGWIPCRTCKP